MPKPPKVSHQRHLFELRSWSVASSLLGEDIAPELPAQVKVRGNVYGRPGVEDGTALITSAVDPASATLGDESEGSVPHLLFKTKSGHAYVIGKPDPSYEGRHPAALRRLYQALLKLNEKQVEEAAQ
jgi:hypothetical protein